VSTEILSPGFEPTYRHPSRKHDDGATGGGAKEKESSKTPKEKDIDFEGCEEIFEQLQALVHMSPECEFFVALYEEMIDLRTAITEKDAIIKEQNLLINRLECQLNEVAAILCDHEKQLYLSKSVVDADGTISDPLGEQEMNVFRLLQGVMVDLLDLDDIYEASEVTLEDLRHDVDPTTTNQTPSRGVIPAKKPLDFRQTTTQSPTQTNTSISTDP
jgi:hypothetical protein